LIGCGDTFFVFCVTVFQHRITQFNVPGVLFFQFCRGWLPEALFSISFERVHFVLS
jgi:hypothetical protein